MYRLKNEQTFFRVVYPTKAAYYEFIKALMNETKNNKKTETNVFNFTSWKFRCAGGLLNERKNAELICTYWYTFEKKFRGCLFIWYCNKVPVRIYFSSILNGGNNFYYSTIVWKCNKSCAKSPFSICYVFILNFSRVNRCWWHWQNHFSRRNDFVLWFFLQKHMFFPHTRWPTTKIYSRW